MSNFQAINLLLTLIICKIVLLGSVITRILYDTHMIKILLSDYNNNVQSFLRNFATKWSKNQIYVCLYFFVKFGKFIVFRLQHEELLVFY